MKRLIGTVLLVTFLNGCSGLPLVSTLEGSLSINGAIAGVTGKYEHQAVNAVVNLASHKSTGKTVSQHLYAAVENKYTEKRLKKHFKNKQLTITDFRIASTTLGDYLPKAKVFLARYNVPPIHVTQTFVEKTKIKWNGFNYRVYDTTQPNFEVN